VGALPAALDFGVELPHHLGFLVADVELPILLERVADIEEAVLGERREILSPFVGTIGVAKRGHELDLEVGDVVLVDHGERRVIPIAVVAHAHEPVLRRGRCIQEILIRRFRR